MVNRLDYDGNAMCPKGNRGEIKFMTNSTKQQKAGQTVDAKETNKQKEEWTNPRGISISYLRIYWCYYRSLTHCRTSFP